MIVGGAVVGWLAAFMLHLDRSRRGLQFNLLGGIAGALVAGLVISPAIGTGDLGDGQYDVPALIVSILGAAVTLVPINLLRDRIFR